jgi:hypothetical protein
MCAPRRCGSPNSFQYIRPLNVNRIGPTPTRSWRGLSMDARTQNKNKNEIRRSGIDHNGRHILPPHAPRISYETAHSRRARFYKCISYYVPKNSCLVPCPRYPHKQHKNPRERSKKKGVDIRAGRVVYHSHCTSISFAPVILTNRALD